MLSLLLMSCTGRTALPRTLWLRQSLIDENTYWMARSPEGLSGKYAAMAADPYDFMRGSAGTWYADVSRLSAPRLTTALLEETTPILLVGDAHPENLSTTLPGIGAGPTDEDAAPELGLELIDLDAVTFGPWLLDLRRSALSVRVMAAQLDGCQEACADAAVSALVAGYTGGARGLPLTAAPGAIIAGLLEEAHAEGLVRKKYNDNIDNTVYGQLQFRTDPEIDRSGAGLVETTPEESAQLERLLADYDTPQGFRMLAAARRYGTGISSRAAVRYLVLWDQGSDDSDDNAILTIRELTDPPAVPGLLTEVGDRYYDNAARIEAATALWSDPEADGAADGLRDGALDFKVLTWSSWFQGIDHLKVIEDWDSERISAGDLAGMAGVLGHTLGSSHRRGVAADGRSAAAVLDADLDLSDDVLTAEVLEASAVDQATLAQDYALFRELRRAYGPLLGADTLGADLP